MSFTTSLQNAWSHHDSLVCVGLDPELKRLPAPLQGRQDGLFEFCRDIVDATADLACAFKPQIAHFAALRAEETLERVIAHIHAQHPGVPVILDAKRGDIGSTAERYAIEAFERYRADAVTLNPYLGKDSAQPFLEHADKGVILLCHTSNPGAGDLQDLLVDDGQGGRLPLYQHVAKIIARDWNSHGNCALVTGATWPEQLGEVRALVGDMPLLVPGIGAQGGDVEAVLKHGSDQAGKGLLISSSRAIIYASQGEDYAAAARAAARELRDTINQYR